MMILPQPAASFDWVETPSGWGLVCRPLERVAPHMFTTRQWLLGSPAAPGDPWSQIAGALSTSSVLRVRQVHGADLVVFGHGNREPSAAAAHSIAADIIAADDASAAVAIQTADCVPLLLADSKSGTIAAAHAGWRGTALGVAVRTVEAMARLFDSRPADLVVAIGPCIGPCCYEVGWDVRGRFAAEGWREAELARWFVPEARPSPTNPHLRSARDEAAGRPYLDLWTATRDQLEQAGVPNDRIFDAQLCTAAHPDLLCSYRRDGTAAGRLAAAIRMAEHRTTPTP